MELRKIGIASLDPTVGAIEANLELVVQAARQMSEEQCSVGAFTEQVLSGYPTEDLVQWRGFLKAQWSSLLQFAETTTSMPYPTVFVVGLSVADRGLIYNAAAVVAAGRIAGIVPKENLPTYDVFYERRVFSRGRPHEVLEIDGVPFGDLVFRFPFATLGVEVCEDMWVPNGPIVRRSASGAELIVNISASPFRGGVADTRRELVATRAADNEVCFVYANQCGGQDSLVFDGGGHVNQNGRMMLEAERWRRGVTTQVVDLDRTRRRRSENTSFRSNAERYLQEYPRVECIDVELPDRGREPPAFDYPAPANGGRGFFGPSSNAQDAQAGPLNAWYDDLVAAMKMGLAGYFEKTGAFERLGIALSGGKDSALTLAIAWLYARDRFATLGDAERPERLRDFIHVFSMPTRFNTATTKDISRKLADELGVRFFEVEIEDAFDREVEATCAMLPPDVEIPPLALQNIQARIRGQRMWNWANAHRGMWLQSGNMSEKAVGYTTIGGDLMGAYSLIGNLPKTIVIRLLTYLHESELSFVTSLSDLLQTKASAELSPNQEDERDLMPFPVLDACFALFAGEKLMPVELYRAVRSMWTDDELREMRPDYRAGMLKEWVKLFCRLFLGSIFKWVQSPQAVHLGALDLDRDRALQLPVVQSPEWLDLDAIDAVID